MKLFVRNCFVTVDNDANHAHIDGGKNGPKTQLHRIQISTVSVTQGNYLSFTTLFLLLKT